MSVWIILLATVPAMVYSRQLIELYVGNEYAVAGTVLLISLLSLPIGYANGLAPAIAAAKGIIRPWVLRGTVLHGANLTITIALVCYWHMGALGSALGTAIAECVGGPLLLWPEGLRLAGIRFSLFWREVLLPGFLPGIAVLVLHLCILTFVLPTTWLGLGVAASCGSVLYLALVLVLLRPEDQHLLSSMSRSMRARFARLRS